jgi:Lar family restriction alleviation protein
MEKQNEPAPALLSGDLLGPCPFCGTTALETVSPDMCETPAIAMHSYPGGYRVECEACCTAGPWHHNHEAALAAWNNRHNDGGEPRSPEKQTKP